MAETRGITTNASTFLPRRYLAWVITSILAFAAAWGVLQFGPFFVGALVGAAVVLLTIVRYPWLGIVLLVASVPAQEFGAIHAGGQAMTLTRAMFPLALVGYFVSLAVHRDTLRASRLVIPFAALVGIMTISITWATSMSAAGAEIGRWLIAFISFILALHFLIGASERRILVVICVMALAGVFEATFGVTQSIFALGPESFRVGSTGSRAFGTFGQPNSYAGYLEMVLFPVGWIGIHLLSRIPGLLREYSRARRDGMAVSSQQRYVLATYVIIAGALLASAAIILGGILASYSRGAWLGVAAGAVVTFVLFHSWARRAVLLLAPLGMIVILGGSAGFLPASISERVTTGFDDVRPFDASRVTITDDNFAAAERMAHWQAGWGMFAERPAIGVGAGNFNERYPDYYVREDFRFSRGHAHNFYIHLLAETGIFGLVAYLVLVGSVAVLAITILLRAPAGFERMLALGAFGTIVSVGVHNVFENLHVLNLSIQLGVIWALVITAHRRWKKRVIPPDIEMSR